MIPSRTPDRLSADQRLLDGGMRPEQPRPYVAALVHILTDHLADARRRHDLGPTLSFLRDNLARSQRVLRDVPIACGEGCWFCCTRWVDVKGLEALAVARAARDTPHLLAALETAQADFGGKSFEARKTVPTPCPMLVEQRCSVYAERPLACRTAVSRDAATCRRSFLETNEPIPRPLVHNIVGRAYALALTVALHRAGLDHRAYEYTGALLRACRTNDAEPRWLDGEDIFAGVARSPGDLMASAETKAFVRELDRAA